MDNTDKVVMLIDECRDMHLEVLPPRVNMSDYRFTVADDETIVYGLGAIKGVGESAIESILDERRASGNFSDLFDFCRRVETRKVNRRVLEALIRAGALDELGSNRATLIAQVADALKSAEQHMRNDSIGMDDLFGGAMPGESAAPVPVLEVKDWDDETRLQGEKETLGLYLTGHPIARYEEELARLVSGRISELNQGDDMSAGGSASARGGQERSVVVAGLVVSMRTINTRRGRMAVVMLDDRTGRMEATLFSDIFEKYRNHISKDTLLVINGLLGQDDYSGGMRLNVEAIYTIDQARERFAKRLEINLGKEQGQNGVIKSLAGVLTPYREGDCPVLIQYHNQEARAPLALGVEWNVRPTDELLHRLRELIGQEQVELVY
jgi:DNA polymerase-3 subunit alpha